MEIQSFAGNPLNRSIGNKKSDSFVDEVLALENTKIVVVSLNKRGGKTILCLKSRPVGLVKISISDLINLLEISSIEELISRRKSLVDHDFIVLGQQSDGEWLLAVSFPVVDSDLLPKFNISENVSPSYYFEMGRNLLMTMIGPDLAIAGQALAMAGWHDENRYCSKTGQPTISIESGLKRQSITDQRKVYPRIDPVAIALVWSPDRSSFLLGNMKKYPSPYFFSCLSGFVEPCESIEEAVCREIYEESGIVIDISTVQILRSQPWPIGRTGGCELMIGCSCVASSIEINIQDDDVREVRWFTVEEITQMLTFSTNNHQAMMNPAIDHPVIPGPYAIAYHLLKYGVDNVQQGV